MLGFDKQVMQTVFRNGSSKVHMKLTHLPTGRTIAGETYSSQHRLREKLLRRLEKEVGSDVEKSAVKESPHK